MATEFWPRRDPNEPIDCGRKRISPEEFLALPTEKPFGNYVHWRELKHGRWTLWYRGSVCGEPSILFWQPIIGVPAA